MEKPKVSIIVPIHNAGAYLEGCLSSLANQSLHEVEFILVLDCPTDGSDEVAMRFAEQDDRFVILRNTENLHTGLSRNRGMELARGEYIGFMDHDDYCDLSMFEQLYNKAVATNAEVVRCNFLCVYGEGETQKIEKYKYPDTPTSILEKDWLYEHVSGDTISCVIWNHIYKKTFLDEHKIQFLDSRTVCSEDSIFFMEVYNAVKHWTYIDDYLYYHVFHQNNTGKAYSYRSIENRIHFFDQIYAYLRENNVEDQRCIAYMSKNVAKSFYSDTRQAFLSLPMKQALKEVRQIGRTEGMKEVIRYFRHNKKKLYELKPTIIAFLVILGAVY